MKEKNKAYTLHIDSVTTEGNGVSRTPEGKVVFTPLCCAGDTCEIKIIKETKSYLVGKLIKVVIPSPNRVQPDCGVFNQCGGCTSRHMDYEEEKRIKHAFVVDCLRRIGGCDVDVEQVIAPVTERYRNKAQYPLCEKNGVPAVGYYARHSHRIITHEDCRLQPVETTEIVNKLLPLLQGLSVYDSESGKGYLRHIYLRRNRVGDYCVMPVINSEDYSPLIPIAKQFTNENVKSFYVNINTKNTNVILGEKCLLLNGEEYLTDILCEKSFLISPLSFWQVNPSAAEMLLYKAKEFAELKENDIVCDLYCGTGTVGICCADKTNRLFGIEIIPEAIEDAKRNAANNGFESFSFVCADSEKGIEMCKDTFGTPDVVFTDPPRKGMTEKVISDIAASGTKKVVYISCNPATMARDVKLFASLGFKAKKCATYDLFPRTSHIESVVFLEKGN